MKERSRLIVLNPTCLEVLENHRTCLDESGLDWVGRPEFAALSPGQADRVISDADALILPASIRNLPSPDQMAYHRRLKTISIAASGYDWLDVDAATQHGIVVTFAPAREGIEVVADLALGFMLSLARRIPHHDRRLTAGDNTRGMGICVWGKTLGIVGLGRIGSAVARRAAGFDMRILAVDPRPDPAVVAKYNIQMVPLETLLRESDFISLHVRLTGDTRRMIGAPQFRIMKPTAYLINTARQELVDDPALAQAIQEGRIGGAGLDDPPSVPARPLLGLPNVIFAPHHGNRAIEGVNAVFRLAIENARQVLSGIRPENIVNPEVYGRPCRVPQEASQK